VLKALGKAWRPMGAGWRCILVGRSYKRGQRPRGKEGLGHALIENLLLNESKTLGGGGMGKKLREEDASNYELQ